MHAPAQRNSYWTGASMALCAATAFGASTPLCKLLLGAIDPWMLAGLLYLGSGSGLGLMLVGRKVSGWSSAEAPVTAKDLPWVAGTVFFGGLLGPLLLVFGLNLSDAASASLTLNLEAVFTLLLAWIVFKEHVDQRLFIGACCIVAGALLLSWRGQGGTLNLGLLLIAGACLSWAIDNNLTRNIAGADPYVLTAIKGLCAGFVNVSLALWLGAAWPDAGHLAGALLLGFLSYGLGLVLFILALRHLGAARTGAYYGTAPFIGAIIAIVPLAMPVTPLILVSGILMGIGAWLHLAERHDHEHLHSEIEHDHAHRHDEHHQHSHDGPVVEPHSHPHRHAALRHRHVHYPDLHHRHRHK